MVESRVLRFVVVVIPMQAVTDYKLLFPKEVDWERFRQHRPDIPFSEGAISFLSALSKKILRDPQSRAYPDVVTFAFFCRRSNLLIQKKRYTKQELRLGRGVVFHIAPSNVPINFAYSLVSGLLSGNINIVRVSSKTFPQVDLVIRHIGELFEDPEYTSIASRIVLVRYDRHSNATAWFSSISNVRLIWGGDDTIAEIRKYPIPARSFDVCFSDRYSIAVLNPDTVMSATDDEISKLVEGFYQDTYLFDQNACSAPHLVLWLDRKTTVAAKQRFWKAVYEFTSRKYQLQAVMGVDKLTAFYRQAVSMPVSRAEMPDNLVFRAELKSLCTNIDEFRCACGYFSEYTIKDLNEIIAIITVKYQTLGYYGFSKEDLTSFVENNRLQGLDRIVPIGETTNFSFTWDGYDLIETLTRIPSIL